VSHELRTRSTSIIGYSEMLMEGIGGSSRRTSSSCHHHPREGRHSRAHQEPSTCPGWRGDHAVPAGGGGRGHGGGRRLDHVGADRAQEGGDARGRRDAGPPSVWETASACGRCSST
jgi:signal transduction histidine kinase